MKPLSRLMWILRNNVRRSMIAALAEDAMSGSELARSLDMPLSTVRHHLRTLRKYRCVKVAHKAGRKVYRLGPHVSVMRFDGRIIFRARTISGEEVRLSMKASEFKATRARRNPMGVGRN